MPSTLIIGAGVIGLATAYTLARAGATVTLLERLTPGSGASLASLGALWPSRPSILGPAQNFQRQSLWLLEPFLRQLASDAQLPIHFRRGGHLEILTSPKAAADALRDAALPTTWPTFGHSHPLDYLPPNAPLPAPIAPDSFGVLHSHVTAQIDLPSYIAALTAACTRLGVTILTNTPVTSLVFSGTGGGETVCHALRGGGPVRHVHEPTDRIEGRVTAARTATADFPADTFLITAGVWTPLLDPLLARHAPIRPVKGQAIEVECISDLPQLIMRRDKTYIVPGEEPPSSAPRQRKTSASTKPPTPPPQTLSSPAPNPSARL